MTPRPPPTIYANAAVAVALLVGIAGCPQRGEEAFQLAIKLAQTAPYPCPSASCNGIVIDCEAVVSVRLVDANTGQTYASLCEPLPAGTLCNLGELTLPEVRVPTTPVNVDVLVWPRAALTATGICPTNTKFDPYGFPLALAPSPALGGQRYFTPGDERTVEVTLGCVNVAALGVEACEDPENVRVLASLVDIESRVPVGADVAERVTVGFGEPVLQLDEVFQPIYRLFTSRLTILTRQATAGIAEWVGLAPRPDRLGCVHVLDDVAEAVGTVTCVGYDDTPRLMPRAYFVDEARRNRLLAALGLARFPNEGLVYGLVLDVDGEPLANAQVMPSVGAVNYLEVGQTALRSGGTSGGGDFVSTTAPLTATWSVLVGQEAIARPTTAVGGLISEKLTIVILRLTEPVTTN